MKHAAIAADTNLLRHPTPRRYLTVFEALRNRPVVVLPAVDAELHKHLPIQARDYIESTAKRQGVNNGEKLRAAKAAAANAASNWWRQERERNDSAYIYAPDYGHEAYAEIVAQLPGAAFTDEKDSDQWIYAEDGDVRGVEPRTGSVGRRLARGLRQRDRRQRGPRGRRRPVLRLQRPDSDGAGGCSGGGPCTSRATD